MGNLWRQSVAAQGEQAVTRYFEEQSWNILERNWRWGRFGEIDLIMLDESGLLVFVEVKTRRKKRIAAGFPESGFETINWRKQQKIVTSARCYVAINKLPAAQPTRFDVVLVEFLEQHALLNSDLSNLDITHVRGAFCSALS